MLVNSESRFTETALLIRRLAPNFGGTRSNSSQIWGRRGDCVSHEVYQASLRLAQRVHLFHLQCRQEQLFPSLSNWD